MKKLFVSLRNKTVLRIIIAIVIIGLAVVGFLYLEKTQGRVFVDNSLVNASIISIAPQTSGKLTQLNVYENEKIRKGDPLAVIGSETLYADTDGLIISAPDQVGSIVNSQVPVIQMINPSDLRIAGTIDEDKGLNEVRVGQIVSFTIDALPGKTFWGYVDEIAPSAKQTQISFSISSERPTQQFIVYAKFNYNNYPEIKNGMSAKMVIYTQTN